MSLPIKLVAAVLFALAVAVHAFADDLRSPADFAVHRRSRGARPRALHRGRARAAASALRELPSGGRAADAGDGRASAFAAGVPRRRRPRRDRPALHHVPPGGELRRRGRAGRIPNGTSRRARWPGSTSRSARSASRSRTRARNGGKTLAQIHDHMAHDSLVGWGWAPGATREPAPGTQAQLGALIDAWIQAGAACPAR